MSRHDEWCMEQWSGEPEPRQGGDDPERTVWTFDRMDATTTTTDVPWYWRSFNGRGVPLF